MVSIEKEVKYINYQYKGCPVVNETYGSLVKMLDIVLCKGFNIISILSSENLENNQVKINLPLDHGYVVEQVVEIFGSETPYFNTTFRVLSVDTTSIVIELNGVNEPITNLTSSANLKIKTAPLGFKNVYSNISRTTMCFKNTSIKSPGILKVIDEIPPNGYEVEWAKYARVVMGKEIDSKGNFINNKKAPFYKPFPNAEKTGNGVVGISGIHGYAKWRYSITDDSYSRECYGTLYRGNKSWELIGDSNTFYLILNCGPDTSVLGFGNIKSGAFSDPIVLQAADSFSPSDDTSIYGRYGKANNDWGNLMSSSTGSFIMTDIYGNISEEGLSYNSAGLFTGESFRDRPWRSDEVRNYNPFSGKILTGKLYVKDTKNFMRGYHRGLNVLYGSDHPSAGRLKGTDFRIINITDHIGDGIMPLMFTMKNWEPIE